MSEAFTIGYRVESLSRRMNLAWIAGQRGAAREVRPTGESDTHQNLVGPLNFIHPNRVQLIGRAELGYLDGLGRNVRQESIARLFVTKPVAIVLTDGTRAPRDLAEAADAHDTPLLATTAPDHKALENLQYFLWRSLAERVTLHGVLLEVLGIGVLLTGDPAVGKSELALEMISRGHRLVADDAPELMRVAPDIINGACPPMLQDFLEVRGLGLLNIRALFGESAIKRNKYLRLIIDLKSSDEAEEAIMERLTGSTASEQVLGLDIPRITIPVAPGRNMAILVETAVRNHMLHESGYDASEDFIERQRRALEADEH